MEKFKDILWFFVICGSFVGLQLLMDFLLFRAKGYARPDKPGDNGPIITDALDAFAQRIIDHSQDKSS